MAAHVQILAWRRDLPWALLLGSAASWALLAVWNDAELGRWLRHDYHPREPGAQVAAIAAYAVGWVLMTLAMMGPAAGALLAAFGRVAAARPRQTALRLAVAGGVVGGLPPPRRAVPAPPGGIQRGGGAPPLGGGPA